MNRGHRGFTLIELMIVVIIVGVLAAVAIPLYQLIPERSMATEAEAGLGLVKNAMRSYYAEHHTYADASFADGASVTVGGILGVSSIDLEGRYFSSNCYTFDGDPGANTFSIICDGDASTAPAAADVAGVIRRIDQSGEITDS
ncbi:MAG: prepilin-type N-terminal cleavage/methylation domain-containing protein [Candidatus Eisenbacteria bacterium]|nr:prepilin-type N-terminal cleavage/methylation domain-containing protein [Candidatus Eisenbacteria bacterium]